MESDIGNVMPSAGGTFFPAAPGPLPMAQSSPPAVNLTDRVRAITGSDGESIRQLGHPGLYKLLLELCAQLGERTRADVEATNLHENGTPRVSSLVAVWLIGRVSEAFAPGQKIIKLSAIPDADMLRSIGGVTALLIRAMQTNIGGESDE